MNLVQNINIILRGLTLLGKVFLFLFLAKYLEPNQVGLFGLIMVSIGFSIYVIGIEFYTYSTRELLKFPAIEWGCYLKSQLFLHIILYFFSFPILITLFIFKLLPWKFFIAFFLILFLEHITIELSRLLIAFNNQIKSSIVIFFKSGFWCIISLFIIIFFENFRTIDHILLCWILSLLISLFFGLFFLYKKNIGNWKKKLKLKWIFRGIKIAIPLLISTLALRTILTIDRYWIDYLLGSEILGVYVLFIGFVASMMSFMDAGVFSFRYPNLIRYHNLKKKINFKKESDLLKRNTILYSSISIIVALIIIKPILSFINKEIYYENIFIFYSLLVIMIIYILSMVPHYLLYAQRYDKVIINSHLIALFIFIFSTFLISMFNPYYSVLFGLILSFSFILIYKTLIYFRYNQKNTNDS